MRITRIKAYPDDDALITQYDPDTDEYVVFYNDGSYEEANQVDMDIDKAATAWTWHLKWLRIYGGKLGAMIVRSCAYWL